MKTILKTALFLFALNISFGQTYFEDDFNGSSLTNNNAWVVYNVIPNSFNHEWFHDVFSGNGRARVTNFDNVSSTNEELESWLISPAIDLTGASDPILYFDNTKRFAGDDIALYISTDYGGSGDPSSANWDDITTLANFNTTIGNWDMTKSNDIDLSSYNDEMIYVAFKYTGSNSDGSTYQIDNLVLEEDGTTPSCAIGIFCDDFEGGSLTANNPWVIVDVISNSFNHTWALNTFSGSSRVQISNFDNSSSTNEELESWLITPAIDLSSFTDVVLNFDNTKRFAGDDLELLVSIDYDGAGNPNSFNWDDITSLANFDTDIDSWNSVNSGNVSLASYEGESEVYIAFKYYGDNASGSTYRINNVLVEEFTAPGFTSIYDIQFTTDPSGDSPLNGEEVTTAGIVTAVGEDFYFIQDGAGEWSGVEVFDQNNEPNLGDSVVITGTVEEYFGMTQIASISSFNVETTGNPVPNPTIINCSDVGESYEGVLIRVLDAICTNEDANFNMWEINDGTAAQLVDDKMFLFNAVQGEEYTVTGVINYAFSNFRISPRNINDLDEFANIQTINSQTIKVYPNPASEYVSIEASQSLGIITVTDVLGNVVYQKECANANSSNIDISYFTNGVYFIQVGNQQVKLVKH